MEEPCKPLKSLRQKIGGATSVACAERYIRCHLASGITRFLRIRRRIRPFRVKKKNFQASFLGTFLKERNSPLAEIGSSVTSHKPRCTESFLASRIAGQVQPQSCSSCWNCYDLPISHAILPVHRTPERPRSGLESLPCNLGCPRHGHCF